MLALRCLPGPGFCNGVLAQLVGGILWEDYFSGKKCAFSFPHSEGELLEPFRTFGFCMAMPSTSSFHSRASMLRMADPQNAGAVFQARLGLSFWAGSLRFACYCVWEWGGFLLGAFDCLHLLWGRCCSHTVSDC